MRRISKNKQKKEGSTWARLVSQFYRSWLQQDQPRKRKKKTETTDAKELYSQIWQLSSYKHIFILMYSSLCKHWKSSFWKNFHSVWCVCVRKSLPIRFAELDHWLMRVTFLEGLQTGELKATTAWKERSHYEYSEECTKTLKHDSEENGSGHGSERFPFFCRLYPWWLLLFPW